MADTVRYGMGQLRYVSDSSYMIDCDFSTKAIKTSIIATSDSDSTIGKEFYQDVYLSVKEDPNFNFVAGVPYLLHLDIPKNLSYDCIYQIKMITAPKDSVINNASLTYQMIKYITVPRMAGIGNTSRVILYPTKDKDGMIPGVNKDGTYNNTKVAIAKTLNDNPVENDVIFDEPTKTYYIYDGSKNSNEEPIIGKSIEIKTKHDNIMEHTWATANIKTETVGFDMIFTPRSPNVTYNGILVQMQRSALDYDLYSDDDGVYGRKIDISNDSGWKAYVYRLVNLIDGTSVQSPLTNIGVYSHPNLLMAINGEEIRVGQSGYYELNDFEITSLAIAAKKDGKDKFTVDYQYRTTN